MVISLKAECRLSLFEAREADGLLGKMGLLSRSFYRL